METFWIISAGIFALSVGALFVGLSVGAYWSAWRSSGRLARLESENLALIGRNISLEREAREAAAKARDAATVTVRLQTHDQIKVLESVLPKAIFQTAIRHTAKTRNLSVRALMMGGGLTRLEADTFRSDFLKAGLAEWRSEYDNKGIVLTPAGEAVLSEILGGNGA